jgi:hypothetical protein
MEKLSIKEKFEWGNYENEKYIIKGIRIKIKGSNV